MCRTTDGLHESRTKPASVNVHVAHPFMPLLFKPSPCRSMVYVVGPSEGYQDIDVQQCGHGQSLNAR